MRCAIFAMLQTHQYGQPYKSGLTITAVRVRYQISMMERDTKGMVTSSHTQPTFPLFSTPMVCRSSSVSLWPIWAVINELPQGDQKRTVYSFWLLYMCCRFKRQHMLLLGTFYSSSKPLINMFLRPVMDDLVTRDGES